MTFEAMVFRGNVMMSFSGVKDVASGSLLSACGVVRSYAKAISASKKNKFLLDGCWKICDIRLALLH